MDSISTVTISKSRAPKPLTTRRLKSGFGRLAPSLRNWMKACRYTRDRTETLTEMRGHNPSGRVRKLLRAALAFRAFHAIIAIEMLLAIAYVWWCALSGRRDRLLHVAAASLIGEVVLVAANDGDCPLGGLQERLGDPVPLFELVLSARRKAGGADAWRHHRSRACPTDSARSTRRPLGGEVDEMALCGASGTIGALRGFVSR